MRKKELVSLKLSRMKRTHTCVNGLGRPRSVHKCKCTHITHIPHMHEMNIIISVRNPKKPKQKKKKRMNEKNGKKHTHSSYVKRMSGFTWHAAVWTCVYAYMAGCRRYPIHEPTEPTVHILPIEPSWARSRFAIAFSRCLTLAQWHPRFVASSEHERARSIHLFDPYPPRCIPIHRFSAGAKWTHRHTARNAVYDAHTHTHTLACVLRSSRHQHNAMDLMRSGTLLYGRTIKWMGHIRTQRAPTTNRSEHWLVWILYGWCVFFFFFFFFSFFFRLVRSVGPWYRMNMVMVLGQFWLGLPAFLLLWETIIVVQYTDKH